MDDRKRKKLACKGMNRRETVYVMQGVVSLSLSLSFLLHLSVWRSSCILSTPGNVCRWVDRYLGRGFWQCEPKPPLFSFAIIPPLLRTRHSPLALPVADLRRVSFRFFAAPAAAHHRPVGPDRLISVNNRAPTGIDELARLDFSWISEPASLRTRGFQQLRDSIRTLRATSADFPSCLWGLNGGLRNNSMKVITKSGWQIPSSKFGSFGGCEERSLVLFSSEIVSGYNGLQWRRLVAWNRNFRSILYTHTLWIQRIFVFFVR